MTNRFTRKLSYGKKALLVIAAILFTAGPVAEGLMYPWRTHAQSRTGLQFEVASIRPTEFRSDAFAAGFRAGAASHPCGGGTLSIKGTLVSVTTATVCAVIRTAYDVKSFQVTGVPAALGPLGEDKGAPVTASESMAAQAKLPPAFYDIVARAPGPAPPSEDQAREMLRGLLRDRFALTLHRESRNAPYYALIPAKGSPKLTPAVEGCKTHGSMDLAHVCGMTMQMIAVYLDAYADRPVLDVTGIPGKFDYDIPAATDFATARGNVGQFLNLKLDPRQGPVDFFVVDHVERPSEN